MRPRPDPAGCLAHPRRATTASASHVPRFARAFAKASLFRCVSPFSALRAGGNKAEKIAFANSCPALSGGARVSVWARPGAIRPGRGSAGCPLVAVSVPPLRPVCSRGAPGGAPSPAADRRAVPPFRARFRRAPPGRSARRSALRAPAPVLCACPPRGFCPFDDGFPAGFLARVGLLGFVSRVRSLRSLPLWPCAGGLVSRGAPPSSSRGVGGSRAGQVAAARCLSVQRVTRRPARGQEAARRGGVGDSVPGAAAAAPWPSCAPWQGVGTLHPPRRFARGAGATAGEVGMIRAGLTPRLAYSDQ